MTIPELKLRRPWTRIAGTIGIFLFAGLLFRCGADKEKKNSDDPTPPGPQVPAGWDATADWTGSPWKVTDE